MCGRYTARRINLLRTGFDALVQDAFEAFSEKVSQYNIAPSQLVPIVRLNSNGARVLTLAKWGLIPSWTTGTPSRQPCNARAETVPTSAMFREAFRRRRCLVPADGFYEWKGAKPPRQPFFVHRPDDGVFAFAGIWERSHGDQDDGPQDTFAIITTTPNAVIEPIHNRMPVILASADYAKWLDPATPPDEAKALLRPAPDDALEAYPVSALVNKPANDGPELIKPSNELQ